MNSNIVVYLKETLNLCIENLIIWEESIKSKVLKSRETLQNLTQIK
jgi:hypothetical protein